MIFGIEKIYEKIREIYLVKGVACDDLANLRISEKNRRQNLPVTLNFFELKA